MEVIGHADRAGPLRDYCTGLVAASGRKSVEPMTAITAPERTAAQHQSLLHFVGQGAWSDGAVLAKVREMCVTTTLTAAKLAQSKIDIVEFILDCANYHIESAEINLVSRASCKIAPAR